MWKKKNNNNRLSEVQILKEEIEAYRKFLEDDLGFSVIKPSYGIPTNITAWDYVNAFNDYQEEHKGLNLSSHETIAGSVYDLRESKYNKLAIEKYELEQKLLRMELALFMINRMIIEYEDLDDKNPTKVKRLFDKIAKSMGVNGIVSAFGCYDGFQSLGGDGRNAEEVAQNKLLADFKEYLLHEDCDEAYCKIGDNSRCLKLRKKFDKRKFERDMKNCGWTKKQIDSI